MTTYRQKHILPQGDLFVATRYHSLDESEIPRFNEFQKTLKDCLRFYFKNEWYYIFPPMKILESLELDMRWSHRYDLMELLASSISSDPKVAFSRLEDFTTKTGLKELGVSDEEVMKDKLRREEIMVNCPLGLGPDEYFAYLGTGIAPAKRKLN